MKPPMTALVEVKVLPGSMTDGAVVAMISLKIFLISKVLHLSILIGKSQDLTLI